MKTKKTNWLLIGAAALAMGACSEDEFMVEEGTENGKKLFTFEATMDADTRTTFNADYSNLTWAEGDQLSFFTDAGDVNVASTAYAENNVFKASLSSETTMAYAIYPYASVSTDEDYSIDNKEVYVYVPTLQTQKKAGELNGANVPMYAETSLESGSGRLAFQPLASIMAFNVYGVTGEELRNVTFFHDEQWGNETNGGIFSLATGKRHFKLGAFKSNSVAVRNPERFGSVTLAVPHDLSQNKISNKSNLVYLAVSPATYKNVSFIVTTDKHTYRFTCDRVDLSNYYSIQPVSLNLSDAKIMEIDNLNERFEDSNFLQFLLDNYDANKDGIISSFEADMIVNLRCSDLSIGSLKGIEFLENMSSLNCDNNLLTSLDISGCAGLATLSCKDNQLTNLNVSGCTELEYLDCHQNQLTSLNVSGCTKLETLYCWNNQLTNLNVSGCTGLKTLWCDQNQLTDLDVSGCTGLKYLDYDRYKVISLNVSGCTGLEYLLYCSHAGLQYLNVSGCTGLTKLNCGGYRFESLDVSGCTGLTELRCGSSRLTSLDLSDCTGLTDLDCSYNGLTDLDVSGCAKVMTLVSADGQPYEYAKDKYGYNIVDDDGKFVVASPFKFYKAANQTIERLFLTYGTVTIEK